MGPKSAFYWQLLEHYYDDYPNWYAHFGPAPKAGQRFKRPDMVAHSLALIRDSKGEAFYRGELADDGKHEHTSGRRDGASRSGSAIAATG